MQQRQKGFTLIELMITVAVIAILSAVAYPSYQEYLIRSRRVEGQSLLSEAAVRQERYRAQNGGYTDDVTKLKLPHGDKSEHGYYTLTLSGVTSTDYTLLATRTGAQAKDTRCGDYTLNAAGQKGLKVNTPGTSDQCWR
ncbi:type IV pilin protein [Diaphorobacter sp.]|uniref:type IV pilin protein n=1 Tax=Diaphorobacter sp. TaxID=1934310 RepID=UPI0028AF3DEC|nr:type IV pilin protein [Diaphorobacter sp.]